ncbi:hypothetical protein [Candidatus Allofournierella merdipullorum]|uniref:hypothetical protein n=1 Tax=Candidatus Allofournierella merdipullorum TaxID=2838595 RepID=UPI00374ED337
MRRYFRWVFAFALVFGLLGAFSSVHADTITTYTAYGTQNIYGANGVYEAHQVPSIFSDGAILNSTFNANSTAHLGYRDYVQVDYLGSTYPSAQKYRYEYKQDFSGLGIWVYGTNASVTRTSWYVKPGNLLWSYTLKGGATGLHLAHNDSPKIRFEGGQKYIFSMEVGSDLSSYTFNLSKITDSDFHIVSEVQNSNKYYVVFYFDETTSIDHFKVYADIQMSDSEDVFQVRSFAFSPYNSDGDITDAIRDQTDDMNKNHQDTMDKIDDVTDFDEQEQSGMTGQVDDVKGQLDEKLGILSFADTVIGNFIGLFKDTSEKPGLVFPGFDIEVDGTSYTVWEDTTFDLSTIDTGFAGLMSAVRFATSFLVYAALFMYVQKIFSAIMQDWSERNG